MAYWYGCTSWKHSPLHTSWSCTHTGISTFCPPHGPAVAALVQLLLLLVWTAPSMCWFQPHGGCPELFPMGFAWELFLVHLSKSLAHFSHTVGLSQWSSSPSPLEPQPQRWHPSNGPHRGLGSPKHLWSPQSQGAETWTLLGARAASPTPPSPEQAVKAREVLEEVVGRSPSKKAGHSPSLPQQQCPTHVRAGMCSCAHPDVHTQRVQDHSLFWGDGEPARSW